MSKRADSEAVAQPLAQPLVAHAGLGDQFGVGLLEGGFKPGEALPERGSGLEFGLQEGERFGHLGAG